MNIPMQLIIDSFQMLAIFFIVLALYFQKRHNRKMEECLRDIVKYLGMELNQKKEN